MPSSKQEQPGPQAAPQSSVWTAACTAVRQQRTVAIPRRPGTGPAPLTHTQANYWAGTPDPSAAPTSADHTIPIEGPLDLGVFQAAMSAVVREHHILRSTFTEIDGNPGQTVGEPPERVVEVIDLSGGKAAEELHRLSEENASATFDLVEGSVYRAKLVRLSQRRHVLLAAFQHLGWDAWSWPIFARELRIAYKAAAGAGPAIEELPIQIADLAHWQRCGSYRQLAETQLRYWTQTLRGLGDSPRLLGERRISPGSSCPVRWFALPPGVIVGLRALRAKTGASLFVIALACLKVLIRRYTGSDDVFVQAPMAYRMRSETRRLIGPCYNFALLRSDLAGDPTLGELLESVRVAVHGALDNQDVSFADVLEALSAEDRGRALSVRVQVDWRTLPTEPARLGSATFGEHEKPRPDGKERSPAGKEVQLAMPGYLDLLFQFLETRDGLYLRTAHRAESFNVRALNDFVDRYKAIVLKVLRSPDRRLSAVLGTS